MMAYLDNSATTRPTEGVISAMVGAMRDRYFNPSSVYAPAVEVSREVRNAREAVLRAIGAEGERLVFTSGGTEANNLAILGAVARMRGRQLVAVGAAEHASVAAAFDRLEHIGHDVRRIPVDRRGDIDWDALERALSDGAAFVSLMHVNNETGAVLDVRRLHEIAGGRALVHIDGVQGFLRVPFLMKYADMYTLSAHKFHGPKGIGALAVRKGVRLMPSHIGGGQEEDLRSGTENTPGIAGLVAAMGEMDTTGLMDKKLHMARRFAEAVPDALINGPEPEMGAPHILNISFPGVRGETLVHALEAERIYASTGSACSSRGKKVSRVLTAMGLAPERAECALRFSLSPHTTVDEIDYAAGALGDIVPRLRRFQRR